MCSNLRAYKDVPNLGGSAMGSQRCFIPLYLHPPLPPREAPAKSMSGEESDFPPIREAADPPVRRLRNRYHKHPPVVRKLSEQCSSPSEEPGPSQPPRPLSSTGLGSRNRLNTIVSSASTQSANVGVRMRLFLCPN